MLSCERRVLRRTEEAGEFYELWMEPRESALVFGEDSQGPLTSQAFGEEWHRSLVEVDSGVLSRCFSGEEPCGLLSRNGAQLCDLLDELDGRGLAYRYLGLGSSGIVSYRSKPTNVVFSADA